MAIGGSFRNGAISTFQQIKKNPVQFSLAVFLVMCCGATKKFQTFPMPWVAGQSACIKEVTATPNSTWNMIQSENGKTFKPLTWLETKADCKEKAKVFTFTTEQFTITTANLVFFGVVKAVFNFVTGVSCDRWGRKWTLVAGWVLGLPMVFMVLFAKSWWTAAAASIFLGMQQALVWSATIFIMVDYLGQSNAGIAIGLNETIGYTTIAIVNKIAAAIMDEDNPRSTCYYVVLGLIVVGILLGALALKESKVIAVKEEADSTGRQDDEVINNTRSELVWPSGRKSSVSVGRSAFIYTSFVNTSLMTICVAGLMINFISGFAWGLFAKWMKNDYYIDGDLKWGKLSKDDVANVTLCYALPKGVLQMFFGFIGDRIGRKWLIAVGLSLCSVGMIILAITGEASDNPLVGFYFGAVCLGIGTGVMYTNNLAAVCDHSDPSWRSSALGSYRFWRDMGYAVGALVTGLFADSIGIGGSVILTAVLTILAATNVGIFYREVTPEDKSEDKYEDKSEDKSEIIAEA